MTKPLVVLIASAGRRVELVRIFRQAVADLTPGGRVLAMDSSWHSSALHDADEGFIVPLLKDPAYVPEVLALCQRHAVDVIVPTTDREWPVWSEVTERFAAIGTTVAVSSPEVLAIASDKQRTHDWLVTNGFPSVRQTRPAEALHDPETWALPLIAKPRFGSASEGVDLVRTTAELEVLVARDKAAKPLADGRPGDIVVQTVARGREHTIDVFVDRSGQCRCAVPRRRLEIRGGEVSKAVTVRSDVLIDLAFEMVKALPGAYGVMNFQVFADEETGTLAVIELNPRFGGGFPLSHRAGADFARWLLEDVRGLSSTATADAWRAGLVMLRYDAAVFVDQAHAPG
jgi:carbamoyl-phosphate synthase large subunit